MSDVYGEAMDERHSADYELEYLNYETANQNLDHAERFINRVEEVLTSLEF